MNMTRPLAVAQGCHNFHADRREHLQCNAQQFASVCLLTQDIGSGNVVAAVGSH